MSSVYAADAFKTLFLHHWLRLARNPREALGYLFDYQPLKRQFAIGSGMTVQVDMTATPSSVAAPG
jgi:hypothetical protein